ncbi:IS1096 element passenger TnpR family protein [Nocardia sp. R6R-6]|uniref:IS1096 element passenger TnpR family protein n=1 Tax=Nocardia sp. R6R-6 TaxID=3459303 RepID=UPI00403D5DC1
MGLGSLPGDDGASQAGGLIAFPLASAPDDPADRNAVPSRRRPRRSELVTFQVRIDLRYTSPPVWRRLELASDLFLDELHDIVQSSFGWDDSHLHQFGSGREYYGAGTEYYLCPQQIAFGEQGVPEDEVRLDEVLTEIGEVLFYCYDFGDDWQHMVKLEKVLPRTAQSSRARCIAGRRRAPVDDCGGVPGFELLDAATDPEHKDQALARVEFIDQFGDDVDADDWAPIAFDIDKINAELAGFGVGGSTRDTPAPQSPGFGRVPGVLVDALLHLPSPEQRKLRRLLAEAGLDGPVEVDIDTAAALARPFRILLDHVGRDGVKLSAAGYMPPAVVAATFADLGLAERWIGKGNREDLTPQVAELRQSAQRLGLLRKYQGRLMPTTAARRLYDDPVGLWFHIAERFSALSKGSPGKEAAAVFLLAIAAGRAEQADQIAAECVTALGWRDSAGRMAGGHVAWLVRPVVDVLVMGGLLQEEYQDLRVVRSAGPNAAVFARAVLGAMAG